MAQADDIKALQAQVKDLAERLDASDKLATELGERVKALETAEPPAGYNDEELVKRIETLENAEPVQAELVAAPSEDGSKFAALEERIEKVRAFVNAPL